MSIENLEAPKNTRIVCEPTGLEFPFDLIYTGTREGLNVWQATRDIYLPAGTQSFVMKSDTPLKGHKVDVYVGWEGQQ